MLILKAKRCFNTITPFLALLLLSQPCIGQPVNFRFVTWSVKNGLANNYVNDCVADKRGLLWIATQNGLSRFDGVNIKNYFHNETDSKRFCGNINIFLPQISHQYLLTGANPSGDSLPY